MLYPALAIFSMVACSRLPFGKPSLRTGLFFFMRTIPLRASARIHLPCLLHGRDWITDARPPRQRTLFLLFSHLADANSPPAGNSTHAPAERPSTLHLNFS